MNTFFLFFVILLVFFINNCSIKHDITLEEAKEITSEAYTYGFHLVMGQKVMIACVPDEENPAYKGPFYTVLRLYSPEEPTLNVAWSNP